MVKKVLIVTYYWPPAGGPGVQRWLKFVKYLSQKDYEITVFTVSNGEYAVTDETLEKDIPKNITVIKSHIWEPFSFYKRLIGQKKEDVINPGFLNERKKAGVLEQLSIWVRGNFFIPDARRFWITPAINRLNETIKKEQYDALITTGPPHSAHMIGLGLKKKFPQIKWIADFRDPWTSIDYFKDLKLTKFSLKKHLCLEKAVLNNASELIVVGNGMKTEFEEKTKTPITVITNGFDPEDFMSEKTSAPSNDFFSLVHVGMINKDRNHTIFYQALSDLKTENELFRKQLKLRFAGKLDNSVYKSLDEYGLNEHLEYTSYINHSEVFPYEQGASLLYLPINNSPNAKGILTGKLFEYLAVERPILCIGPPDGDAGNIINECEAGSVTDFSDLETLKKQIRTYFEQYLNGSLELAKKTYKKYSRIEQTAILDEIINRSTHD